jgi:hypothetical protein
LLRLLIANVKTAVHFPEEALHYRRGTIPDKPFQSKLGKCTRKGLKKALPTFLFKKKALLVGGYILNNQRSKVNQRMITCKEINSRCTQEQFKEFNCNTFSFRTYYIIIFTSNWYPRRKQWY